MKFAMRTCTGGRENNQDTAFFKAEILEIRDEERCDYTDNTCLIHGDEAGCHGCCSGSVVAAVFDGVGGHKHGFQAAYVAAKMMSEMSLPDLAVINRGVLATGGASTVAGVQVQNGEAQIFWAGDSRVYLVRDDEIILLSRDDTELQVLVDANMVSPIQVRRVSNGLTNCLGIPEQAFQENRKPIDLQPADRIILLTDGVWDPVEFDLGKTILLGSLDEVDRNLCKALTQFGNNENSEMDNWSFLIIDV